MQLSLLIEESDPSLPEGEATICCFKRWMSICRPTMAGEVKIEKHFFFLFFVHALHPMEVSIDFFADSTIPHKEVCGNLL